MSLTAQQLIEALKKVPPDSIPSTDFDGLSVVRVEADGTLVLDRTGEDH